MTITKERLHEIIVNNSATHSEFMAITSMLLGCMEQEPIAWVSKADVDTGELHILARRYYSKACPMPVYASPVTPRNWKLVPSCLTPEMKLQMHTLCNADCPDCGKEFAVDVTNNIEQSWADILAAFPEPETHEC